MIRVQLPHHLRTLARVDGEVKLAIARPVTTCAILDALETRFPMLRGTMRAHETQVRRPKVRFYACMEDITHDSPDEPLPEAIASGTEPFLVIAAISGG
jgi:hypothetical protein